MSTAINLDEVIPDQFNYKRGIMQLGVEEDAIYMNRELDFPAFQKVFMQIT